MKASVTKANIFTGLNYSIIGVFTSFEYKNNMKRPLGKSMLFWYFSPSVLSVIKMNIVCLTTISRSLSSDCSR